MVRLSDPFIRNLKPPERGQVTYRDDLVPGFGIRVSQGGTKTFTLMYGARRTLHTIGRVGIISLSDARTEAKRLLAEHTLGRHRPKIINFDDAKIQFLAECADANKARTVYDYTRLLKRFGFGREQLADISPHDIDRRLSKLPSAEKHHAFVVLRAFFNWAHRKHYLAESPMSRMAEPPKPKKRERVLSEDEIKSIYSTASDKTSFGNIVLLLLLTGQRRGEIAALRREYIDDKDRTITLPASLTKNNRQHTFPYGDMVAAILETLPKEGYLFPASRNHVRGKPTSHFNSWSKSKTTFDEKCPMKPWTLHDFRRTLRSTWAELGILREVAERYINHISGIHSGLDGIYNRYSYMTEMRDAVLRWETHLNGILTRLPI